MITPPLKLPKQMELPVALAEILADAAIAYLEDRRRAFRADRRPRQGATLRPGKDTLLWNALVAEVDVNRLVGIGVHQFAVNNLEFDDVDGRAASPAAGFEKLQTLRMIGRTSPVSRSWSRNEVIQAPLCLEERAK